MNKISSDKQINANRQNALKSTGPRSEAGKDRSKRNALTHGLTAQTVVIEGEDPDAFEAMRQDLIEVQDPQDALEFYLVDRAAGLFWRLQRVPQIEASLLEAHRLDVAYDAARDELALADGDRELINETLSDAVWMDQILESSRADAMKAASQPTQEDRAQKRNELKAAQHQRMSAEAMLGRTFRKSLADNDAITKLSRYERELARMLEAMLAQLERARAARRRGVEENIVEKAPGHGAGE